MVVNEIIQKHKTTITLGENIAIGQFGQQEETAKPGRYSVVKLEHNWKNENVGAAYLFVHESETAPALELLETVDYLNYASIDGEGYGLCTMTDDSFDAKERAWFTAPDAGTGFVAEAGSSTFDIYVNKERTVFLLDADSIYFHYLLWPQWTDMETQTISTLIQGWGNSYDDNRVVVDYYDQNDNYHIEEGMVPAGRRKIDVAVETMLVVIGKLSKN